MYPKETPMQTESPPARLISTADAENAIANLLRGDPENHRPADILLVFLAQQELERIRKAEIAQGLRT
jgi:hypothetical protein